MAVMTAYDIEQTGATERMELRLSEAQARFKTEAPAAVGVRWWTAYAPTSATVAEEVVGPLPIVSFSTAFTSGGREAIGRKQLKGYTMDGRVVALGPTPDPDATGDPR